MKYKIAGIFILLFNMNAAMGFTIDRAIVSSNDNPTYLEFWPLVARAWNRIGIRPTLFLVASEDVVVDETCGDVIRFEPIPGINTGLIAQVIRLLAPIYFEDEVSLISDIDMFPISKKYFVQSVAPYADDMFVVYRDRAYPKTLRQYPMCYNAAKGSVFKEVFNIESVDEIPALIYQWTKFGWGWNTDERVLLQYINNWKHAKTRCVKLGHKVERRIDRSRWKYNADLLAHADYYIDCHSLRPYDIHKAQIDRFLALLIK